MGPRSGTYCSVVSIYIHTVVMYVCMYGPYTYVYVNMYIYTYIGMQTRTYTACVFQAEMEDRVKAIQNTRTPTGKMLSDNFDVTQGLKQPPLYLEQFLRHLNALGRASYFVSTPAEAFICHFFLSEVLFAQTKT